MSKGKFNLFSRSALASMAAAAVGIGLDAPAKPGEDEDEDPEAGPTPDDPEETQEETDAGMDKSGKKKCGVEEGGAAEPTAAAAATPGADDVVSVADATAVAADQFAAGRKAERERTAAVLGSDIGKANPAMAGWMLSSSPDANADAIIAQLKTMPGAAAPAAGQSIPDTNVDLGKPGAAAAVAEGGGTSGDDVWADVQGTKGSDAPVVASDAGRATLAALQAGARTVNTGGAAASTPSTPAVVPTGN